MCLPPGEQASLGEGVMGYHGRAQQGSEPKSPDFSGCLCLGSKETIEGTCRDFWGPWISCLAGSISACLQNREFPLPELHREGEGESILGLSS